MFRNTVIALIAIVAMAFVPTGASARGGFGVAGWRCGPIGLELGLSFAGASYGAHGPYGYGFGGYDDGCIQLRQIMTRHGLRIRCVNICY